MQDIIGSETLRRLARLDAYSAWQYRAIEPYLGRRVMEIGSGIGNISSFLLGRERCLLTDISADYLSILQKTFGDAPGVKVAPFDLESGQPSYRDEKIDSVVCLNVLEHVKEDRVALGHLYGALVPGGRLILLVPAHPRFYGTLDRALGHFRRYTKNDLAQKIRDAGFTLERIFYFNRIGIFGWWWNGQILKKTILPSGQLGLFGKLVPFLSKIDPLIPLPLGLSLVAVAKKGG